MEAPTPATGWVSSPEVSDENVSTATGKTWNEWRGLLDEWGAADHDHPTIAAHLATRHRLDGWWAQAVAGGYERITGRRLPNQMPDGTFTAIKSRTVTGSAAEFRALLDNDTARSEHFGGRATQALSKPGVKVPRFTVGPGEAKISVTDKGDGRMSVGIQHEKLPSTDAVTEWKLFWAEWLEALDHE